MLTKTTPFSDLTNSGRWRAEFHVHGKGEIKSRFTVVPLGDVVAESKKAMNPSEIGSPFHYVGLENVEPVTGEAVDIELTDPTAVRSRSKVFASGDILFGRLRPNLRKVMIAEPPFDSGLCSTECIVLRVDETASTRTYLRDLLVSEPVVERLKRMQSGAALPRVSSKDLLRLKVPVPPLDEQRKLV